MVAGIENLGEGLLKGYQFGLQQQRQQQQDARQATLDQQNQEQHNLSMQANQFNLDQAKKKATLDEATRSRTLNFNKTLQQAVLMNKSGNKQGAFTALVQGNNNDPQATHNIEFLGLDDSGMGSIRYIDKATGKAVGDGKLSAEDAIVMFHQTLDPAKAFADELAKKEEERKDTRERALDLSTKIAEEKRAQQYRLEQIRTEKRLSPEKPRVQVVQDEEGNFINLNLETNKPTPFVQKDGKPVTAKSKEEPLTPSEVKTLFNENYEVGKDVYGQPKFETRINNKEYAKFVSWTVKNKRKATMGAYNDYLSSATENQPANIGIKWNGKGSREYYNLWQKKYEEARKNGNESYINDLLNFAKTKGLID